MVSLSNLRVGRHVSDFRDSRQWSGMASGRSIPCRHCEARSDEAIHRSHGAALDRHAPLRGLAMTAGRKAAPTSPISSPSDLPALLDQAAGLGQGVDLGLREAVLGEDLAAVRAELR